MNVIKLFLKKIKENTQQVVLKYIMPIVSILICIFKFCNSSNVLVSNYFYVISAFLSTNVSIACTILTENMIEGTKDNIAKETGRRHLIIIFSLVFYILIEMSEICVINKFGMVVIWTLPIIITLYSIFFTFKEIKQDRIKGYDISEEDKRNFEEAKEKKNDKFENSIINLEGKNNE